MSSQNVSAAAIHPLPDRDVRVDGAHEALWAERDAQGAERRVGNVATNSVSRHAEAVGGEVLDEDDGPSGLPFLTGGGGDASFSQSAAGLAQHATELAERLQNRLHETERRESRLNAQEAEFDSRVRSARLWIAQREEELERQQQELSAREEALRQQQESAASILHQAADLEQKLVDLTGREKHAEQSRLELEIGLVEQQTRIDALDFERASCRTRQEEFEAARDACEQRQRQLDQREAELYAAHDRASAERIQLDAELRRHADRDATITRREQELREWERRLREEASVAEFQRNELERTALAQEEKSAELSGEHRRLKFRQQEIETALKRFERLGVIESRINDLDRRADELDMRSTYLDNAEAILAEQQRELSEQRRQLEEQQLAFENRLTRERQALVTETSAAQVAAEQREQQLERRDQALDKREAALDELAEQLRSNQRETLEMRLATEETWLQLQGALAPATLSRSIAHVRTKLAEHFQYAAEEVATKRADLENVRRELAEQFARLDERQQRLQNWADSQQRDMEQQAARLTLRERELDEQHREFRRLEVRWNEQRTEYQNEIQRLLGTLRKQAA